MINWRRELEAWLTLPLSVGGEKDLAAEIVVVSYEQAKKHRAVLEARTWDLIIGDEAHAFKNWKAQRTQTFVALTRKSARKLLLTGTPIENRPIELYSLLNIVMPGEWGTFMKFGCRYANGHHDGYAWNFKGASNLEELQDRLRATCMVRRLKKDVLKELPAKRRQIVVLDSDCGREAKAALKAEREMIEALGYQTHEARVEAELAKCEDDSTYESAVARLTQAAGVEFTEVSKVRAEVAIAKVPKVIEYLQDALESSNKVIVFAHHHSVIDALAEGLKDYGAVTFTGQHSTHERQTAVDRFQHDSTCRVFIGSIKAAGVGITLTAASLVVFAELDWVPGAITQGEDRAHRISQTESVNIQHLVFDGSLDARMAQVLVAKQEIADRGLDIVPVVTPHDEPLTPARRELIENAAKLTPEKILEIHNALRMLAGVCDGAEARDTMGFNKIDTAIGSRLARLPSLSAKQAALGWRIARKYHRQVGRIEL